MIWTSARMPGTRVRGIARRRMEPGGAYQRSLLSSATYPPPVPRQGPVSSPEN